MLRAGGKALPSTHFVHSMAPGPSTPRDCHAFTASPGSLATACSRHASSAAMFCLLMLGAGPLRSACESLVMRNARREAHPRRAIILGHVIDPHANGFLISYLAGARRIMILLLFFEMFAGPCRIRARGRRPAMCAVVRCPSIDSPAMRPTARTRHLSFVCLRHQQILWSSAGTPTVGTGSTPSQR